MDELIPQRMSFEEARQLVMQVQRGQTLSLFWEGPDSYCQLVVSDDPEHGLLATSEEWPYDITSPARNIKTEIWNDARLIRFLRHFPREAVKLEPETQELISDDRYNRSILVGACCRTLHNVTVAVKDYDSGSRTLMLPAGSAFQPWMPQEHWRGREVPITLGHENNSFDWGQTSFEGHFLNWDDFFTNCVTEEQYQQSLRDPAGKTDH